MKKPCMFREVETTNVTVHESNLGHLSGRPHTIVGDKAVYVAPGRVTVYCTNSEVVKRFHYETTGFAPLEGYEVYGRIEVPCSTGISTIDCEHCNLCVASAGAILHPEGAVGIHTKRS